MTQIHVIDKQTDEILADIQSDDFWSELRKRTLSGIDVFDFETFADKEFSKHLSGRNRLVIPSREGGYAEFIIEENEQLLDRRYYIFANGSFLELAKLKTLDAQSINAITADQHVDNALSGIGSWRKGNIQFAGSRSITLDKRTNGFSYLKKVASTFNLEVKFRIEVEGNKVVRYVDMVDKIGAWRGHEVVFGRNLVDIKRHEDSSKIVTALNVYSPADSDGNRKHVYVTDDEALQRWGREGKHLEADYYPESNDQNMTIERLTTLGVNELEKRVKAVVTYSATMADIEKEVGESVQFGDEIKSKDEGFSPPLYLEARIHTLEEDLKGIVPDKTELGDYVELAQEDVFAIYRGLEERVAAKIDNARLAEYAEKKIVKSVSAPTDTSAFWLDTSVVPNVLMSHNGTAWVKATPTQASEVGSYSTAQVDNKLTSYVGTTIYDNDMSTIQAQIDNQITSHFKDYEPTLSNEPASLWTDNAEKDKHIGDLFYNSSTGYSYRFMLDNTVYKWTLVRDEGIAKALQDASQAQDTADSKRRVFVAQPTTPYDAGDLWDNDGKVYRSTVDKTTSATFSAADWYLIGDVTGENTSADTGKVGGRPSSDITDKGYVSGAIDNIDIGGRNLLLDSKDFGVAGYGVIIGRENGFNIRYVDNSTGTAAQDILSISQEYNESENYVLSFWVKGSGQALFIVSGYVYPVDSSSSSGESGTDAGGALDFNLSAEWKKMWIKIKTQKWSSSPQVKSTRIRALEGSKIYMYGVKIERGNKATDWTPAPEDVQAYTDEVAATKADKLTTYTITETDNKLLNYVGVTSYQADQEGVVQTLDSHGTRLGQNENAIALKASQTELNTVKGTVSDNSAELTIQAGQIESKVDATYVSGAVADIEIGGRNLVLNSSIMDNKFSKLGGYNGTMSVVGDTDATSGKHVEYACTVAGTGFHCPLFNKKDSQVGKTYTWSFTAKCSVAKSGNVGHESGGQKTVSFTTEWKKFSYTWVMLDSTYTSFTFYLDWNIGEILYIRDFKIEKGNKATDWTPAPEDVQGQIDTNNVTLSEHSTSITQTAAKVETKADSTVVDTLTGRVDSAESTITQHANEIDLKVNENGVIAAINLTSETARIQAANIDLVGAVTADSIKSLNGLNVGNGQFVVDGVGNVTFGGELFGASGTFSGNLSSKNVVIGGDDPYYEGYESTSLRLKMPSRITTGVYEWVGTFDVSGVNNTVIMGLSQGGGILDLNFGSVSVSGDFRADGVMSFSGGPSFDMTGGDMRLRASDTTMIRQNADGTVFFIVNGSQKHVFFTDGTKSGGSIEIDGVNLGMSPIDSPQILLEYVVFNLNLSREGVKVQIEERFRKGIEQYALFPNNGEIIEKGYDYFIIAGNGIADIRVIGKRVEYKDTFFIDMENEKLEGVV